MIINQDILKWCEEYTGPKFHAVLCDPPYELGFMGKSWDSTGIAFDKNTWAAISKHLHPGAYLLAFGGTRTFHRIAVAIEDAGFEVRDCVLWVYSTGFPKSHNFGCKCQRGTVQYRDDEVSLSPQEEVSDLPQGLSVPEQVSGETKHNLRKGVSDTVDFQTEQGTIQKRSEGLSDVPERVPTERRIQKEGLLLKPLQREGASEELGEIQQQRIREETTGNGVGRSEESGMEGRSDVLAEARELQADKVHPVSEGVSADGAEGWLHNGTPITNGSETRTDFDANGGGSSHQPRPAGQSAGESDAFPKQQGTQTPRVERGTCAKCGGLLDWQGYGSALKPAFEPIIVARKPLEGTMKDNALKYGSGALNIDGCRVGTEEIPPQRQGKDIRGGNWSGDGEKSEYVSKGSVGRWPANLIHDGSDEVVGMFPRAKAGAKINAHKRDKSLINLADEHQEWAGYGDDGSAARFFYSAKVSKRERDAGLEGFEETADTAKGNGLARICETCGVSQLKPELCQCETKSWVLPKQKNGHPCLKPISLTTYLAKLILPPKLDKPRRLLVPFSGSGSEVIGGFKAGWDEVVGVEQDAEYCTIAEARVKHWTKPDEQESLL